MNTSVVPVGPPTSTTYTTTTTSYVPQAIGASNLGYSGITSPMASAYQPTPLPYNTNNYPEYRYSYYNPAGSSAYGYAPYAGSTVIPNPAYDSYNPVPTPRYSRNPIAPNTFRYPRQSKLAYNSPYYTNPNTTSSTFTNYSQYGYPSYASSGYYPSYSGYTGMTSPTASYPYYGGATGGFTNAVNNLGNSMIGSSYNPYSSNVGYPLYPGSTYYPQGY